MVGIYKITNLINGHSYIGQSVCIKERWNNHRCAAKQGLDYALYRAMRKYGLENFSFEVIEGCKKSELNERECYWISYYDTYNNGYNHTLGGQERNIPKTVVKEIVFDLQNSLLTMEQIGAKYNLSRSAIKDINNGYTYYNDDYTYPLRAPNFLQQQNKKHNYCIDCGKEILIKNTRCLECLHKSQQTVERPEPVVLAQEILSMGFCAVGRKYGKSDNAIRKWCKAYNMPIKKPEIQNWLNQQLDITASNDV